MGFPETFALVRAVPGWLTEDQARVLHDAVGELGVDATVVEIGSHLGRSTIVLAAARADVRVVAVDPFPTGWRYGEPDTEVRFREHVAAAGIADRVDLRVTTSRALRQEWAEQVDLLYVDGKHDYRTVLDDLTWASYVPDGGVVLVHDAFSSLGVTLALLRYLLPSRQWRYVDRTGSLARLELAPPTRRDRVRVLRELPWFARNLVVKVLLRLRMRPLAAALGHHDTADPY